MAFRFHFAGSEQIFWAPGLKTAVISEIKSALESKIAELQGLLNQVKGLK